MLVFRNATIEDAPVIAELHATSWQQNYREAFSDTFLDKEALNDRMQVWVDRLKNSNANQFVCVAQYDKSVVGFVCAFFKDSFAYGALLDNLHVSSAVKGNGIGKRLVSLVANEIKINYPETGMYLWVLEQNSGARHFYRALDGEKKETIESHDIGDRPVMIIRYYWPSMVELLAKVTTK